MSNIVEAPPGRTGHAPGGLRVAVCWVTIASCVPYLALKVLWLLGFPTGAATSSGAAELLDTRHIVGDVITGGMELFAVALVLALTYPWGHRLPAFVVSAPIWLAAGLLAPIAVGLPLGLVAQALAGGPAAPPDNGLHGWVYLLVYGGFLVQAIGLPAAFLGHARARWPEVFRMRMAQLADPAPRHRLLAAVAATVAVGYAVVLTAWSVIAPRWGGPAGFDTVAQRTALLSTGLLVLVGAVAVPALLWRRGSRHAFAPLVLAWVGTGVIVTAGPTHIALSNHGSPSATLLAVSATASLCGLLLTRSMIHALPHRTADRDA